MAVIVVFGENPDGRMIVNRKRFFGGQITRRRPPAIVAKMAATIDHISGGRVIVGMGAAALTRSGRIHQGALVENISLGLAMCPERVAMFSAVAAADPAARTTSGA